MFFSYDWRAETQKIGYEGNLSYGGIPLKIRVEMSQIQQAKQSFPPRRAGCPQLRSQAGAWEREKIPIPSPLGRVREGCDAQILYSIPRQL